MFTSQRLLRRPTLPVIGMAALLAAASSDYAFASTATLKSSGGGAWSGSSCTYSTINADSSGNVTVTCQASTGSTGGTTQPPPVVSPPPPTTGGGSGGDTACAPTPANYTVIDYPNYTSSGSVYITTIAPGAGVALRFTIDKRVYPYGYQLRDENGGTKTYVVSRCPGGTDGPVDGQNGTMSVNGDAKADNCKAMGAYVRYKETSGASPTYYNGLYNMYFTSCFLPTTTAQGSGTPATYYLNITNTGNASVGVQFKNEATLQ